MQPFKEIKRTYFVGIGGIGMSALARFFKQRGREVAGYDRTTSVLTDALISEGIPVCFDESVEALPPAFTSSAQTLVVYTPAVPAGNAQLQFFNHHGFQVMKRSEVLGLITRHMNSVCVAGTHGKTTVSTLTAHLFYCSHLGVNAFLGGISRNYRTNLLSNPRSGFAVLEADEFDRSFLQLTPGSAVITSMDADHLDIYGTHEALLAEFGRFARKIKTGGCLLLKSGLDVPGELARGVQVYFYTATGEADFYVRRLKMVEGLYHFDLVSPFGTLEGLKLGIPGLINVENAVAAVALALINGVHPGEIHEALPLFRGIARRFDLQVRHERLVYIDDYAHHPREISATLESVRSLCPGKRITGVFQPHLFSRTKDFAAEFARSLSAFDELVLLPVYPAREPPIPGVDSQLIAGGVKGIPVQVLEKEELLPYLKQKIPEVLVTMGAGDIDRLVPGIKRWGDQLTSK